MYLLAMKWTMSMGLEYVVVCQLPFITMWFFFTKKAITVEATIRRLGRPQLL